MSSPIRHQVGATCPSCGRFVGPLEKCPHCGAQIRKRLPLKYLKLACLVLAVLGIAILVYAVSGAATPTAKIGRVGATMNYAYVQLEGTVTRGPIYDPDAGSLRVYIADDTGEIQATAFRDVAAQLTAQDKIPTVGDKITASGTLRVRDDFTSFNLSSADKLELAPPSPSERRIQDIGPADELHSVRLRGNVREIRQPYQGLTLITLGDGSGELDLAVYGDIEKLFGALPPLGLGDSLDVQGIVTYYRDSPQLTLRRPADLIKLDLPDTAPATIKIKDLDTTQLNQRVQVSGDVSRVSDFSQGVRAVLADDTGEITLLLWQDLYDQIQNADRIQAGARVTALGKLSLYRGELELIPDRAGDIMIEPSPPQTGAPTVTNAASASASSPLPTGTPAPTKTPRPTRQPTVVSLRTAASISTADLDARVRLAGTISELQDFSAGKYVTLQDDTGTIRVVLFENVLTPIQDKLAIGTPLSVRGKVNLFGGKLEIVADEIILP